MDSKNCIKDGEITVFADTLLYSKEAIFKCLYWFGDKFHTSVSLPNSNTYCLSLRPLNSVILKEEELFTYLQKLERDLIDFQLRDIINNETQNIRDLLVAKAFSNGEFDELPPGNVADPLGFNPNMI